MAFNFARINILKEDRCGQIGAVGAVYHNDVTVHFKDGFEKSYYHWGNDVEGLLGEIAFPEWREHHRIEKKDIISQKDFEDKCSEINLLIKNGGFLLRKISGEFNITPKYDGPWDQDSLREALSKKIILNEANLSEEMIEKLWVLTCKSCKENFIHNVWFKVFPARSLQKESDQLS